MNELELRIDEMLTLVDEFGVDAWDTIALKLGHSAKECVFAYRNYYEEFLGARMKRWTEEDQRTLVNAYNAYGFSGWKNIAACFPDRRPSDVVDELYELERVLHRNDTTVPYENTNDSPQRYASSPRTNELPQLRSKLQTSRVKTPWTEAECDALQKIIKQIGAADWHRVSNYLETKTAPECKQQWKKLTRTCTYKGKTTWSPEEDRILIDKFNQYGKQWSKISKFLPRRIGKQCRERYTTALDPTLNKGPWTPRELELLNKYFTIYGTKWSIIAKHLPGRNPNAIKNYCYTHSDIFLFHQTNQS